MVICKHSYIRDKHWYYGIDGKEFKPHIFHTLHAWSYTNYVFLECIAYLLQKKIEPKIFIHSYIFHHIEY